MGGGAVETGGLDHQNPGAPTGEIHAMQHFRFEAFHIHLNEMDFRRGKFVADASQTQNGNRTANHRQSLFQVIVRKALVQGGPTANVLYFK